jgi:CSLREA domain-containing protein
MQRLTKLILLLVVLSLFASLRTRANATIAVNTTIDENGTGPDCSLREAITAANTDAAYGGCPAGSGTDTITFDSSVFSTPQTVAIDDDLPALTTSMNIVGPGANLVSISGKNERRLFYLTGLPVVTLYGITLTQAGDNGYGGTIDLNDGTLTLDHVVVRDNHAGIMGAGVLNANGSDPALSGTLTILNSTFFNNTSDGKGGAIASSGPVIMVAPP